MLNSRHERYDAIDVLLRLRRAERLADRRVRVDIASARDFLEGLVGPTVRAAEASRLLGVSQPALNRWLDKGEIASVTTPRGRREIPLSELLELLEEIEQTREEGRRGPLAAVIRERRRSAEAIDINRLLPPRRPRGHRSAELQSLAYHRLVAERLDEKVVEEARRRLRRWRENNRIDARWADEWEQLLAMPAPRIAKAISADTERARELRQTSPFAGLLTEQERQRLVRAVEERASA